MADEQKFFEVTIPNTNVTIKFPEGTDPATIDQVMRQAHEQAMPKRDEAGMADRIKGMSRQQMVDTYRSLPKDDPLVGYLAERIAKPQQGETPQQAQERAYGKLSDSTDKMGSTGGAAATFLQGVPFAGEWMDEMLAKLGTVTGPNDEQTNLRAIREGRDSFQKENPKTATGLQIGGGLTGAAVTAGMLPWWAPESLAMQVLYGTGAGAVGGAAEGYVSGYGAGTDEPSRKSEAQSRAVMGTALGAGTGGILPVIGSSLSAGVRRLLDRNNISRTAEQAGLSRPSYELLSRALEADGTIMGAGRQGPPTGASRIAQAGPDGMVADAGPAATGLLDSVIQSGGEGARIGRDAVEGRAGRTLQTTNQALNTGLGTPQGIQTMEDGIRRGTQSARRTTYDAAYRQPINYAVPEGQQLEAWFRQVPGDVLQAANRLMQVRREPASAQILLRQQRDGSFVAQRLPDVRQWDYITRAMNDVAQTNDGAGALGGQTSIGSGFQEFSRDIRQTLRGLVGEYGTALDTAADAIDARNALRFGEGMLSARMTRDEVANTLAGFSQAERRHAALGVRSRIDEVLANVKLAATDQNMDAREALQALRDLSSRASREKVTALIGQPQADTLFQQLDQAGRSLGLRANVATNSKTAARQEFKQTLSDYTDDGVYNKLTSGEGINAFKSAVQELFNTTAKGKQQSRDRVGGEIARFLTDQNPQGLLQLLQRIAQQNPQNITAAGNIARLPAQGTATGAYLLGTRERAPAAGGRGPR